MKAAWFYVETLAGIGLTCLGVAAGMLIALVAAFLIWGTLQDDRTLACFVICRDSSMPVIVQKDACRLRCVTL